jgi:hypothetical protein
MAASSVSDPESRWPKVSVISVSRSQAPVRPRRSQDARGHLVVGLDRGSRGRLGRMGTRVMEGHDGQTEPLLRSMLNAINASRQISMGNQLWISGRTAR